MNFNAQNQQHQLDLAQVDLGAELLIPKLVLYPHLGVGEKERETPQPIEINLTIKYKRLPLGCLTDNIEHTLCYHTLHDLFQNLLEKKHFQLIEHLGYQLMEIVSTFLKKLDLMPAIVRLAVHKIQVPLEALPLGAVFSLTQIVEAV